MSEGLWGEEFIVTPPKNNTKKLLNKINNSKIPVVVSAEKALKSKTISIEDKLKIIYSNVERILGHYKDNTVCIKTKKQFIEYIDKAIENGVIAIDTETNNSLDPLTCKLMGLCIYTPGMKNAYIPINHTDLLDNKLDWQLTEEDCAEQLKRVNDSKIKQIFHNGKFDFKVIHCTCNIDMNVYWDTMIGAKLLDENERAGLKQQYINKIDPTQEKYSIDHLFTIEYKYVDPEVFALYAATDAFMTYELFLYQKNIYDRPENCRLLDLFMNVEMPVLFVSADMELRGITIDKEYCDRLGKKYHSRLDEINAQIQVELDKYKTLIEEWRLTPEANIHPKTKAGKDGKSKAEQLSKDVTAEILTSPTQLAILLYDILKLPVVDKESPRGTGEEILLKLSKDNLLCELVIKQRTLLKLINAFIDSLPKKISPRDGRLHSNFNQLGTETGRFSSTDPNLQQIPSRNKEIRMLFTGKPGYVLVGSDFSAQEPRLLAAYSKDENMLDAFNNNRDVYATIGIGAFKNSYWDNMEHHEDGSPNPEGKKRRSQCKKLLLGIMYGRGIASIAEQLECSLDEAQSIIDNFYLGFPKVKNFTQSSEEFAIKNGYVEDFYGRRRHLPDITRQKYTISSNNISFNPLLNTSGNKTDSDKILNFTTRLNQVKNRTEENKIIAEAKNLGYNVVCNSSFIARAKRQVVNSRVQGGAATMSKKAMIAVFNDEEMRRMDFHILIGVHDELIGECPEEYAQECAERLTYLMRTCVPELDVSFKCDPTIEKQWYEEEYSTLTIKEYVELCKTMPADDAAKSIYESHSECTPDQLNKYIFKGDN